MRFLGYENYFDNRPTINPSEELVYQKVAYTKTKLKHYMNLFKLRKEPINRRANTKFSQRINSQI